MNLIFLNKTNSLINKKQRYQISNIIQSPIYTDANRPKETISSFNDLSRSTISLLFKKSFNSVVSSVLILHSKCIPFILSFSFENFCLTNLNLSTPIHDQACPDPESPPVIFFHLYILEFCIFCRSLEPGDPFL